MSNTSGSASKTDESMPADAQGVVIARRAAELGSIDLLARILLMYERTGRKHRLTTEQAMAHHLYEISPEQAREMSL